MVGKQEKITKEDDLESRLTYELIPVPATSITKAVIQRESPSAEISSLHWKSNSLIKKLAEDPIAGELMQKKEHKRGASYDVYVKDIQLLEERATHILNNGSKNVSEKREPEKKSINREYNHNKLSLGIFIRDEIVPEVYKGTQKDTTYKHITKQIKNNPEIAPHLNISKTFIEVTDKEAIRPILLEEAKRRLKKPRRRKKGRTPVIEKGISFGATLRDEIVPKVFQGSEKSYTHHTVRRLIIDNPELAPFIDTSTSRAKILDLDLAKPIITKLVQEYKDNKSKRKKDPTINRNISLGAMLRDEVVPEVFQGKEKPTTYLTIRNSLRGNERIEELVSRRGRYTEVINPDEAKPIVIEEVEKYFNTPRRRGKGRKKGKSTGRRTTKTAKPKKLSLGVLLRDEIVPEVYQGTQKDTTYKYITKQLKDNPKLAPHLHIGKTFIEVTDKDAVTPILIGEVEDYFKGHIKIGGSTKKGKKIEKYLHQFFVDRVVPLASEPIENPERFLRGFDYNEDVLGCLSKDMQKITNPAKLESLLLKFVMDKQEPIPKTHRNLSKKRKIRSPRRICQIELKNLEREGYNVCSIDELWNHIAEEEIKDYADLIIRKGRKYYTLRNEVGFKNRIRKVATEIIKPTASLSKIIYEHLKEKYDNLSQTAIKNKTTVLRGELVQDERLLQYLDITQTTPDPKSKRYHVKEGEESDAKQVVYDLLQEKEHGISEGSLRHLRSSTEVYTIPDLKAEAHLRNEDFRLYLNKYQSILGDVKRGSNKDGKLVWGWQGKKVAKFLEAVRNDKKKD